MRFLRQSLTGVFLVTMTVALLVYAGQMVVSAVQDRMSNDRPAAQPRERVFAVSVRTARSETTTPVLEAFGQVQSRRTLELRAAVGGRAVWLSEAFEDGGEIRRGDVLLRIDPADAQAVLDRARNDLSDAQAEERDAERALLLARDELRAAQDQSELRQRAFQRQEDLKSRGVGTSAAVEVAELAAASARQAVLTRRLAEANAEARIDQAATRLDRARIALEQAQRDLEDTTLTAAFSGTLSGVNLVQGRLVSPNEKLAELIDPNALEVAFRVSTAQYVRLLDETGKLISAPVSASLDVTGAELVATGRISRDSAAAGDGQSGRVIYARLDDARGFKPGDFVTVEVEEPAIDNVVRLPASALGPTRDVLVLGDEDRLETLPVTLVRRQGDDILIRGDGLEGREVVIGRTPLLGAGIRVRPMRQGAQAATVPDTVELTDERRAKLVAFVERAQRLSPEMKAQLLDQLAKTKVPAGVVDRIESRMGG
jgi:RND family efflux transporter MFP subunit